MLVLVILSGVGDIVRVVGDANLGPDIDEHPASGGQDSGHLSQGGHLWGGQAECGLWSQ